MVIKCSNCLNPAKYIVYKRFPLPERYEPLCDSCYMSVLESLGPSLVEGIEIHDVGKLLDHVNKTVSTSFYIFRELFSELISYLIKKQ